MESRQIKIINNLFNNIPEVLCNEVPRDRN